MKQKVLILASWYPNVLSPVNGIFIQDQAVTLSKIYDVAVLAPSLFGWRSAIRQGVRPHSQIEQWQELPVYRESGLLVLPRFLPFMYWSYKQKAERAFEKILKTWGKPGLIHAHVVLPGGWLAHYLGQKHNIPVVLTEHSSPFAIHLQTNYQRGLVRKTLTQVNQVIAVSPALAHQIQTFQNQILIRIVGNLIKTDFFVPAEKNLEPKIPQTITHFLFIGLLTEQKGVTYLLEAVQRLLYREITQFEVFIGGDGPDRPKLQQMTQDFGLSNHCRFLGLLTPSEVKNWMQQCDVFVLPSLHETFGIVLGEAMACGKPVISTRCGGPEFVVTPETGVLVETANSEALAEAMAGFILGQHRYEPQRVRQSVVERFGEEAFLQNITAIYEQLWHS